MLFGQNAAPTGWTRKADWQDNAMLCYASAGDIGSGGAVNPQSTHAHTTPGHTLLTSEIPAHSHGFRWHSYAGNQVFSNTYYFGNQVEGNADFARNSYSQANTVIIAPAGGGGSHAHGNTGVNTAPHYQEVIAATKD